MQAALVILDGWGLGDHDRRNAVAAAETPTVDALSAAGAYATLDPTGRRVGLPEGQMGNSEVGHLNIGAGRVVKQPYTRISDSIADGSFVENDALRHAVDHLAGTDGRLHLMGLVSDGGVHSALTHLEALVEFAADAGVEAITHAFTDGRDTRPTGGADFLRSLEDTLDEHGTGDVATVCGRYFAMDRDQNWVRTRMAYDAIVAREAPHEAASSVAAAEAAYDRGETDEFIEPTLVRGEHLPEDVGQLERGVGHREVVCLVVLGERDQFDVGRVRLEAPGGLGVGEHPHQLAGAVRPEVEEDHRVAVIELASMAR